MAEEKGQKRRENLYWIDGFVTCQIFPRFMSPFKFLFSVLSPDLASCKQRGSQRDIVLGRSECALLMLFVLYLMLTLKLPHDNLTNTLRCCYTSTQCHRGQTVGLPHQLA